ncbi:MAG: NAD(P)-binding protein [Rhodothermaceae bacterium]
MERIVIIGTGISGLGAAYLLNQKFEISLFEKNNYVGGHTNTISVPEGNSQVNFDTGFMVFNQVTYPNLLLFSDISFS